MSLRKILYVEDDPDIQEIAIIALEKVGGFELKICSNGKSALEEVEEFNPDLILLDVMMPEMDGPTTFEYLKKMNLKSAPVIFMTAKVQPKEVSHYINMGAKGVISKPFDPMNLKDAILEIYNRK